MNLFGLGNCQRMIIHAVIIDTQSDTELKRNGKPFVSKRTYALNQDHPIMISIKEEIGGLDLQWLEYDEIVNYKGKSEIEADRMRKLLESTNCK